MDLATTQITEEFNSLKTKVLNLLQKSIKEHIFDKHQNILAISFFIEDDFIDPPEIIFGNRELQYSEDINYLNEIGELEYRQIARVATMQSLLNSKYIEDIVAGTKLYKELSDEILLFIIGKGVSVIINREGIFTEQL